MLRGLLLALEMIYNCEILGFVIINMDNLISCLTQFALN
jgi:hypothetical protein